jgi:hypothetical protein
MSDGRRHWLHKDCKQAQIRRQPDSHRRCYFVYCSYLTARRATAGASVAKLLSWGRRFVVGLTLGMWIDHQCGTLKTHAMADDPPQGAFSDTDEIDRTEEIAYVELETDQDAPIASQLANTGLPAT